MRFDDSLETVLSAEMSSPFGAQSAWRQLVDLIARGRAPADHRIIVKLKAIRAAIPPPVRAASARAAAFGAPPAALVQLFATDELAIAAPVLRTATLRAEEWIAILPDMLPQTRSVLRHRRDLHADVRRALESFGPADFILPGAAGEVVQYDADTPFIAAGGDGPETESEPNVPAAVQAPVETEKPAEPRWFSWSPNPPPEIEREEPPSAAVSADDTPPADTPLSETPFVSLASVALALPVVAEALRQSGLDDTGEDAPVAQTYPMLTPPDVHAVAPEVGEEVVAQEDPTPPAADAAPDGAAPATPAAPLPAIGTFEIAELVARIDAYQRGRDEMVEDRRPTPPRVEGFRFETDAAAVMRWVEGVERAPLVGMSLGFAVNAGPVRVDASVPAAVRRRAPFSSARLVVDGHSDAAGQWRVSAMPVFDHASGRFTGYRGAARRPRIDEGAEPARPVRSPVSDALRQLVHELRTPTNAIAGFAEMIEAEMLGPVAPVYRERAATIRSQVADLLLGIDDLDLAARLEAHALDLHEGQVTVAPLLARVADDIRPLTVLRGATITLGAVADDLIVSGDDRAIERLAGRLVATLAAAAGAGEMLTIDAGRDDKDAIAIAIDRPAALAAYAGDALFAADAESEAEAQGGPLLGTGFALRLVRNLAIELGGSLDIGSDRLTLRLPAAFTPAVGQASNN